MKNKQIRYAMSRRKRNSLLLSAFLLLAALVWVDRSVIYTPKPGSTSQTAANNDWEKYHQKNFTVVKVVDGDTIDIDLPDGKYKTTRIRLLGIDTPEMAKSPTGEMYYGPEASQFTKEMVLGKNVTVLMDENSKTRDKYDRLLCYIKLPNSRILNEELVSQGFAYADTRFEHSDYEKYIGLEDTARKEKKGMWEKVTPDQMPEWKIR
ncbi:MAG: thermonuclease family protein [Phycisphaerae bacterium]|nr:thermonuclease family protein [Phycisphaerae bacterium]